MYELILGHLSGLCSHHENDQTGAQVKILSCKRFEHKVLDEVLRCYSINEGET